MLPREISMEDTFAGGDVKSEATEPLHFSTVERKWATFLHKVALRRNSPTPLKPYPKRKDRGDTELSLTLGPSLSLAICSCRFF